ncbi:MAG: glycosyltransferase family 4 protein, partial [Anaerolineae bacterium]|nr:glycosyltransferase family 4 protein [Anaerolineae bacterium]
RLPTEKAHGLQVMQNCEAFADAGAQIALWVARRINTPQLQAVGDVWAHYGVRRNFTVSRIPCIDLIPLVAGRVDLLGRLAFAIQLVTFLLVMFVRVLFAHADIYDTRDERIVVLLSLVKPRRSITYESHNLSVGRLGRLIQRQAVRRAGSIFAVTGRLRDDLVALGAETTRAHIARDGIRAERFANLPDQAEARRQIGWSKDLFVVGYVGRLQTLSMDKGVGALVDALAQVEGAALALVGGPDDMAQALRQRWLALGQDESRFLYAGHVPAERVPLYLAAFDVCALPSPWTPFFAYYTSPMKLFEYMVSRRPIVASDLPSNAEVVTHGESALLVPPGDVGAIAAAVRQLRDDPALRARLAGHAHELVMANYTWDARAKDILSLVSKHD